MTRIQPPAHALASDGGSEPADAPDLEFAIPESVRKSRILDEFAGVCSEILPQFLYVSSLEVAKNPDKLRALGITHIVNCCKELCAPTPPPPLESSDTPMRTLALALRDDAHEDLSWFFYQVIAFIQNALDSPPSRVLVHCHQGISRSCAFAIAFVMYQQQQQSGSFRDAMAFVKSKRPIASPNTAFLCQLIEWERELSAFASLSKTSTSHSLLENALYRLAPHAAHDSATLVLKSCFKPEAAAQRQKVVIPLDESSIDERESIDGALRHWLFTRGIFVFLRRLRTSSCDSHKVVIWRGCACDLLDGAAHARVLMEQMASVHLASPALVDVEVIEEDPLEAALVDHFGYAKELDWIACDDAAQKLSSPLLSGSCIDGDQSHDTRELTEGVAALESGGVRDGESDTRKPLLFVLEAIGDDEDSSGSWEHLKVYDSEDLASTDAFLLLQPPHSLYHFVWVGDACSFDRAIVVRCAERHALALSSSVGTGESRLSEIRVEEGGVESDAFWAAFERGY